MSASEEHRPFEGSVVLLGDSHLARLGAGAPDLAALLPASAAEGVVNVAVGGSSCRGLVGQSVRVALSADDVAVVSIGTNDAAPWKQVPIEEFTATLQEFVDSRPVRGWVLVTSPGVVEERLVGRVDASPDRTNLAAGRHRDAASTVFARAGAVLVRSEEVLAQLGPDAFAEDGLHLSSDGYAALLPVVAAAVTSLVDDAGTPGRDPAHG